MKRFREWSRLQRAKLMFNIQSMINTDHKTITDAQLTNLAIKLNILAFVLLLAFNFPLFDMVANKLREVDAEYKRRRSVRNGQTSY